MQLDTIHPDEDEDDELESLDDGSVIIDDDEEEEEEEPKEVKAEEEKEEEEEVKASKDNRMIPRSRYNEKAEENRLLKAELADLQAKKSEEPAESNGKDEEESLFSELAVATREHKKAIEDDDEEAAIKADRAKSQINSKIARLQMGDNKVDTNEITNAAVEHMEWKETLKQVYKDYPMLNAKDTENRDTGLIREIAKLQKGFLSQGDTQSDALTEAVSYVMTAAGVEAENIVSLETPAKKSTAKSAAKKAPNIGRAGEADKEAGSVDIADLSDEELIALPLSKQRELQGDFL